MPTIPIPIQIPADNISQVTSYRGWYGSFDLLPDEDVMAEIDAETPWWFPIYDGVIPAQQTDRGQIIAQEDSWLLSLIGWCSQSAGFSAQIYDTEKEETFMSQDITGSNLVGLTPPGGSPVYQFFLKSPVHIPVGGQIQSRVINLATVSNTIQILGFGVRPNFRKKIT